MKKEDMQELKKYCDKIEFYTVQQSVNRPEELRDEGRTIGIQVICELGQGKVMKKEGERLYSLCMQYLKEQQEKANLPLAIVCFFVAITALLFGITSTGIVTKICIGISIVICIFGVWNIMDTAPRVVKKYIYDLYDAARFMKYTALN